MESNQKYKGRILAIGVGVSGLTTLLCLLRDGFKAILVAEKFALAVTSVINENL